MALDVDVENGSLGVPSDTSRRETCLERGTSYILVIFYCNRFLMFTTRIRDLSTHGCGQRDLIRHSLRIFPQ